MNRNNIPGLDFVSVVKLNYFIEVPMRFIFLFLILSACSSTMPVLPKTSDVKVSRELPSGDCTAFGEIVGRSLSVKPDKEAMLEDLKEEAIKKGANYVMVETLGAQGSSIKGQAYNCK